MSILQNTLSANSFMDIINHQNYMSLQESSLINTLVPFMNELIQHLIQLSLTQASVQNIERTLNPYTLNILKSSTNYKICLEEFFIDFVRLFENETNRIKKHGEKKFKYLVQTVSKQIFSDILRMACDLKVESASRGNQRMLQIRKRNSLTLMTSAFSRLVCEKQVKNTFSLLKSLNYNTINKQDNFVDRIKNKFDAMDRMLYRKKKIALSQSLYAWRSQTMSIAQKQQQNMIKECKEFLHSLLPQVINLWKVEQQNWLYKITNNLQQFFDQVSERVNNVQINFIVNPQEKQKELEYSESSRSGISHISQIQGDTFRQCMKKGQIKYLQNHHAMMVPLCLQQPLGVIIVEWKDQLPMCFFHLFLKMLSNIKEMLQQLVKLGTRISYYKTQIQQNSWQVDLYKQYTTEQPSQHNISNILNKLSIHTLQIYHNKQTCIKYGQQVTKLPSQIVQLVYKQLQEKNIFTINRNNLVNHIIGIEEEYGGGFCRFTYQHQQHNTNTNTVSSLGKSQNIKHCILPILLKNYGKIECSNCEFNVREVPILQSPHFNILDQANDNNTNNNNNNHIGITISSLLKLRYEKEIQVVQQQVYNIIKQTHNHSFALMLYRITEDSYICIDKHHSQTTLVHIPKQLLVNSIYEYVHEHQQQKQWKSIIDCIKDNALFGHSRLYLYQREHGYAMKIISHKVSKKALILLASYQLNDEHYSYDIVDKIAQTINHNQHIFTKTDMHLWASNTLQQKHNINMPNINNITHTSPTQLPLQQVFNHANKQMGINKNSKVLIWKKYKGSNKVSKITNHNNNNSNSNIFPIELLSQQCLQSHQQHIQGAHLTVRRSKKYGTKVLQHYAYIPSINTQLQTKYAQTILQQDSIVGDVSESSVSHIIQYLTQHEQYHPQKQAFISVPINININSNGCTYIVMLMYNRNTIINYQSFQAISNYYTQLLKYALQMKYKNMKIKALMGMMQVRKLKYNKHKTHIKQAITKLNNNRKYILLRNHQLIMSVTKIYNKGKYRNIKHAHQVLYNNSMKVQTTYNTHIQLLINTIHKVCAVNHIVYKLNALSSINRSVHKLSSTLSSITKQKVNGIKNIFNIIRRHSDETKENNKLKRYMGIRNMNKCLKNIYNNRINKLFKINRIQLIQLKKGIHLISEQFQIQNIKNITKALSYLQDRFNILLPSYIINPPHIQFQYLPYTHAQPQQHQYVIGNFVMCCPLYIYQLMEPIIRASLSNWDTSLLTLKQTSMKILFNKLKAQYTHNLNQLFTINRKTVGKQNINSLQSIKKKCNTQKKVMVEMCEEIEKKRQKQDIIKQGYRNEIRAIKQNIMHLQNQQHKVSVDANIKSKTNAAYKMLILLSKRQSKQLTKTTTQVKEDTSILKKEIRQINKNIYRRTKPQSARSIRDVISNLRVKQQRVGFHQIKLMR